MSAPVILPPPHAGGPCDEWVEEVWDGVPFMPPAPNDEHADIEAGLLVPIRLALGWASGARVRGPINVSDRVVGWVKNYRNPDLSVYLPGNPAINHGDWWQGGPDFLAEILSPGDRARDKFAFYASIGTREVLLIDRDPWQLELYHLQAGSLMLVGTSTPATSAVLTSITLPVTFRLVPGANFGRPVIEVTDTNSGTVWPV